jgi:hypothetical protein
MPLSDVMFCLHSGITISLQTLIQCNWCKVFVCLFSGALYRKIEFKTCPITFQKKKKNESAVKFFLFQVSLLPERKKERNILARKKFKISHKLEHQHTIYTCLGQYSQHFIVFITFECAL